MDGIKKEPEIKEKKKEKTNNVIIVQTVVCAFIVFLVAVTGKLSPEAFEFLKNEYDEIMSVDMSPQEIVRSAADTVQKAVSVQASAAEPEENERETVAAMAQLGSTDKITVPVHGRISSEYGYRTNPISGAYALHSGVDIAADSGEPIGAAYDGVVREVGTGEKSGKYVLLEHSDGSETLYCHCSEILVDEDYYVKAGETVALVGSTGWATGPHLHFEIRRDKKSVDPLTVLDCQDGRV